MHGCEACQGLLLEYLYDLLEGAERQALLDHLATCPACQAGLAQAEAKRQLLAAAARMEFPNVRFERPAEEPGQPAQPEPVEVLPLKTPRVPGERGSRKRRAWTRWAVAAGLLLALGGAAVPAAHYGRTYVDARARVEAQERTVAEAHTRLHEAEQELADAARQRDKQIEEIRHQVKARELKMEVRGPRTVQSGAPTEYQVLTYDLNGQPAAARIEARVADLPDPHLGGAAASRTAPAKRSGETLSVTRLDRGVYRVTVPPSLPLKPNRSLTLLVSARRDSGSRMELSEQLILTAPVYVTHLTTDKPMYQPGETVYFRSLTLDRFRLAPGQEDFRLQYALTTPSGEQRVLLTGGNGLVREGKASLGLLKGPDGKPVRGIGAGSYVLTEGTPGGEYVLTVSELNGRFPPQKRKFTVNTYQKPRLDKELDYNRSSYGPGDEVQARCRARRADGGPVKDRPVRVTVQIDDKSYGADGKESRTPFVLRTDAQGEVVLRFKLPAQIERGQASVGVTFDDGATVETLVRTIPIVLKKLQVEFFPEGGDLVAGLPNRVYFQVRTPLGKPADLKGRLLEDGKPLSVALATLHDAKHPGVNQGMGRFEFTPRTGRAYTVQVDSPAGITKHFALPKVHTDGVVLRVDTGVAEAGRELRVRVRSTKKRNLMIGAYCRGRLLDSVRLAAGQTDAVLQLKSPTGGVCRVTAFEELPTGGARRELKPLAERLVYREPAERVDIDIHPDRRTYVPGQKVKLSLATTTEKEKFTPTILMVAVVDKSVLTLADEKTARTMPTHFLLTTEIRRAEDLEYADFLVQPHPRAAEALDLLLGTQGWRRFAEQNPDQFRKRHVEMAGADRQRREEEADRLLVLSGQSIPQRIVFDQERIDKVKKAFDDRADRLLAQHEKARQAVEHAGDDADYRAALALMTQFQDRFQQAGRWVGLGLVLAALLWILIAAARQVQPAWPYCAALATCAAGVLLVVLGPLGKRPAELDKGMDLARQMEAPKAPHDRAFDAEGAAHVHADRGAAVPPGGPGGGNGPQAKAKVAMKAPRPARGGMGRAKGGPRVPHMLRPADKPGAGRNAMLLAKADGKLNRQKGKEAKAEARAVRERADLHAGLPAAPGKAGRGLRRQPFGRPMRDRMVRRGGEMGWAALPPLVVREYAHARPPGSKPEFRSDFTETVYWHPVLVLPDGKAEVSFDLCDSVTNFQVTAFAHTLDGRLGAATRKVEVRLPFTLSPKLPLEVTAGDTIDVPLAVSNNTGERRSVQLTLKQRGLKLLRGSASERFTLASPKPVRKLFRFVPAIRDGKALLTFTGKADPFAADAVRGTIKVVPEGFPVVGAFSDVLEGGGAVHTVELPKTWVPGTLKCKLEVYPSTLADLQKGLDGLLREPNGCFEQTSTTNYPNVLVLNYLRESNQALPAVEKRARDLLARGYQKLTSFECLDTGANKKRGYEWFGGTAPAHEALTAYGLMQFRDMARVQAVDGKMLERTRTYLLAQRDGKGGFKRNPRALDTFGRAPDNITNAYIVWSLTESGKDDDISKELKALQDQAKDSTDPYFLSLVANALVNRGKTAVAMGLLKKVVEAQKDDGHLEALQTSITGSGGRDLQIETTALAVLGWLKANPGAFAKPTDNAVRWIGKQRGGYGGFGSTQSTILALKALIAFTKAHKKTAEAGELRLFAGDKQVALRAFTAGERDVLTLEVPRAEKTLKPGKNRLRVEITGKNAFPYTLSWSYQTLKPVSAKGCPVLLKTTLGRKEASEGDVVRLKVRAENVSGKGQGMAVAIVGIPGGLILPEDLKQLKEYARPPAKGKRPLLSYFEVRGRELVLYWRDLAPAEKIDVPIDLVCRVPGKYSGPASRAYLYYNADRKHWVEPLAVTINAKQAE
jgi:hypothetical protein